MLFPVLNLLKAEHALLATKNTLNILAQPDSFINLCGYGPALMDRFHEWLTQPASIEFKRMLQPQLAAIIDNIQQTDLSEEIKASFQSINGSLESPFQYETYEPVETIARHIIRLQKRGEIQHAAHLRRYIDRISPIVSPVPEQVLTN